MEEVHIALASDENYRAGLLVTACSIAEHASRDCELVFHLIDGGLPADCLTFLETRLHALHPSVTLHHIRLSEITASVALADLPQYRGKSMPNARLILPSLLKDVEFCIYSDVDFLWLADIAELWREKRAGDLVLGVHEPCTDTLDQEKSWFEAKGVPFVRERYICTGLTFYNLKLARQNQLAERIVEFMRRHSDAHYPDQTALNAILAGNVHLVDEKWQRLTVALRGVRPRNDFVLHYAGNPPWKFDSGVSILTDALLLWHSHHARYLGTTLWRSLRGVMSIGGMIRGRLYWHLIRCPLTRGVFFALLRVGGRGSCCKRMAIRCEKVRLAR